MLDVVVFGLSAFMAQILTNLDNLAALLALMLVSGPKRSIFGFLLAQFAIIGASLFVALGVDDVVPHWAGYLGVIPLGLGVLALIRRRKGADVEADPHLETGASIIVVTLLFISLSMDTFAVLAPLLADSAPGFRTAGIVGASLAAASLATVAMFGSKAPFMSGTLARRLETLVPYVMICAGLYILSNSWTDAI
ncbi:cadmium resistance transporter [Ruegeria lacuscaerulensis]|uniref:cadmium resistance transporter n=1 Tax=Ruegeria lacuscaerulensis TaxID=55218 RepID=UPI001479A8D3|nr:cadmium resistance transporter [Ruegeria lacuscaerulensis]